MGKSDKFLMSIYDKLIPNKYPMALLCFQNIPVFLKKRKQSNIDLYDIKLNNFDLNSDWKLKRKYRTIVCTRALFFCKDPELFLKKCKEYLEDDGELLIDYFYGHGWTRFTMFKVGWVKNGEHEFEYKNDNYLWSGIWDDSFLENEQIQLFQKRIIKHGYNDIKKAVYDEIPVVIELSTIKNMFSEVKLEFFALYEDMPQLYIFINIKM